ncbi:MAG TPA: autotransporter-associated beta strand repeat-containing protein [Candidatus Sulfotelmatobacter sp.]|nr:autotransporter-associated beta strand repeat-containing protein [Candidatus Sulfotelmatobacter sp.]
MKKTLACLFSIAALLSAHDSFAQTLYWDGGAVNITTNGDGISQGAAGSWDNTTENWDQGSGLPHVAWVSGGNAVFGLSGIASGAGIVTFNAAITANAITIVTTNYNFTDGGNTANTLTVNSVTNSAPVAFTNNIVNSTGFTMAGSSTLTLVAASAGLTGPLTIDAGTLALGNNTLSGPTGFGNVTVAGNATFELNPGASEDYGQTISGGGALSIHANSYSSTVTLDSEANTFTGDVTINQATLSVYSINDSGPSDLGMGTNLIIGAGGSASEFTYTGGGDATTRTITLGGTSQNTIINANNLYGTLTLLGPLAFGSSGQHTLGLSGSSTYLNIFGGTIPDNTNANTIVAKSGNSTWMLTGTNSYSGGTTLSAGTLLITNDYDLGNATGAITFTGSATLKSASNNVTLGAGRKISLNTANANFGVNDVNNFTIASFITGTGAVTRTSSSYTLGTVRFSNDTNNFTGGFTAGFGVTEFTSLTAPGTPCSLGAGSGGITNGNSTSDEIFRYVGVSNSATTRPLVWTGSTGPLALDNTNTGTIAYMSTAALATGSGSKTLTLQGSNAGTNTLAQVINNDGGNTSLVKTGAGEWILTAVNTYSGSTTVSGGTLLVNGSLPAGSSVTDSGGILGGYGTINGPVTVVAGGMLAAGDPNSPSVGMLTIANAVTNSGTIFMKLNASASTNDVITGMSTLVYGGTLSLTNLAGSLALNQSFKLFSAAGYQGAFSSIVPATPGSGLAWNTNNLAVNGTLSIGAGAVVSAPVITQFSISGTTITMMGNSGVANGQFVLLSSTNLTLPLSQWTPVLTNEFDGSGNFNFTTNLNANAAQQFFILSE